MVGNWKERNSESLIVHLGFSSSRFSIYYCYCCHMKVLFALTFYGDTIFELMLLSSLISSLIAVITPDLSWFTKTSFSFNCLFTESLYSLPNLEINSSTSSSSYTSICPVLLAEILTSIHRIGTFSFDCCYCVSVSFCSCLMEVFSATSSSRTTSYPLVELLSFFDSLIEVWLFLFRLGMKMHSSFAFSNSISIEGLSFFSFQNFIGLAKCSILSLLNVLSPLTVVFGLKVQLFNSSFSFCSRIF